MNKAKVVKDKVIWYDAATEPPRDTWDVYCVNMSSKDRKIFRSCYLQHEWQCEENVTHWTDGPLHMPSVFRQTTNTIGRMFLLLISSIAISTLPVVLVQPLTTMTLKPWFIIVSAACTFISLAYTFGTVFLKSRG